MSNLNTRTPTGDDVTQRIDPKPAFSNDLFEQMLRPANLQRAWKQVRANKGAAGIDGMSVDDFLAWVKSGEWEKVKAALLAGHYHPQLVRRVEIEKPDGGKRPLGIPTVIDRVIQQAMAQVLTPIFDPSFSSNSFGFRPGRNGHPKTLQKFKQRIRVLTNRNWGVSMHYQLFKTSQFIRGWINYFGIANCLHIPAHRDRPFRLIVTADSGAS